MKNTRLFSEYFSWQPVYKPGSVEGNHLSSRAIAHAIKRIMTDASGPLMRTNPLQPTGFTSQLRHRSRL